MKWDRFETYAFAGLHHRVIVFPLPKEKGGGWAVSMDLPEGVPTGGSPDLISQPGHVRRFGSLDTVERTLRSVGITDWEVHQPEGLR